MNTPALRPACALLLLLAAISAPVVARDKQQALSPDVAPTLSGKSFGVTRRGEKPSFMAMTAGKAGFALLGAAAMAGDGNKMVKDNAIADPADIVEATLVPALVKQYGLAPKAEGASTITPGNDLKQIIAAQPGADIVLDIRSIGWQYAYAPTHWGSYWVGYAVEARLIESASGKVLAYLPCGGTTQKHAVQPTRDQLLENQAQLLKSALGYLAWNCVETLARDEFGLAGENLAARPAELVDPLADYAREHPEPAKATSTTASSN
jgi:hypothetical protein